MGDSYAACIGREEEMSGRILASVAETMAAALDLETSPRKGDTLPPGWQWLFFNPVVRRSGLGPDGHPKRGGFLPPIELPRRMWAGSRIRYLADLPVGAEATRKSRILKVEEKVGASGALWFVTIAHAIMCGGATCIQEEQDLVYSDARAAPPPKRHDAAAQWSEDFTADTTLLFRYSALTFNGHRIHYDQTYAREQEGYRDLVVHGPLIATLLQRVAVAHAGGRRLARFNFRGVAPLFVDRPFRLEGRAETDGAALWARGPDGELAMSATASFE